MTRIAVQIVINAGALWAAVRFVPGIRFPAAATFPAGDWWKLILVALLFGLLNTYLKPILRAISWPARLLTLGLFSWAINAGLLLLLAMLADSFALGLRIGSFPPTLDAQALVAAFLGALLISVVSIVLSEGLPA